jgi:anti-sigma factor RsiW
VNCKSVQSKLSAYLDRELAGNEMLEMRAHISYCPECRGEEDEVRTLKSLLTSMPVPEPSKGFEARLLRHVQVAPRASGEPRLALIPLFSAVAAAAMVLTLLALTTTRADSPSQGLHANDRIESAIQRDQMVVAGGDPFGGTPIISTSNGPSR